MNFETRKRVRPKIPLLSTYVTAFPDVYFTCHTQCLLQLISVEERGEIENASVQYFRNVISCHTANQMLFAKVLYDVIKEQGSANKAGE